MVTQPLYIIAQNETNFNARQLHDHMICHEANVSFTADIPLKRDKEDRPVMTGRSSSYMLQISWSVVLIALTSALVEVVIGGIRNKCRVAEISQRGTAC